ncbi:MAG: nucleotide disphospho-sugar-binding domain-containing protein [Bacteroidota bacterium]
MAARLREEGYEVTILAPVDHGDEVQKEGFNFRLLPDLRKKLKANLKSYRPSGNRWKRWWMRWTHRRQFRQQGLDTIYPSVFEQLIDQEQPDLLIIDIELHERIIWAYNQSIPVLLLSQWYSLWHRNGLPPLSTTIVPGIGFSGSSLGIWWSWQKLKISRWWKFKRQELRSMGTSHRSLLQRFAKVNHFPRKYIRQNLWPGPVTYSQLPVLAMVPLEMEFIHQPRPNLHYLGPMVFSYRQEPDLKDQKGRTIDNLEEVALAKDLKIIVATGTTMHHSEERFLKQLVDAVASRDDWLLITGPVHPEGLKKLGGIPDNVAVFSFLPQLSALSIADLSVNHGGVHTIHECIHFKVPMLVYSGGRADQNGCAARVQFHEIGIMGGRALATSKSIANKIEILLTEIVYKTNIEKMSELIFEYQKNRKLEKIVLGVLERDLKVLDQMEVNL